MRVYAFDTETALIRPGCLAPEMVCLTDMTDAEGSQPAIYHVHGAAFERLRVMLTTPGVLFVGHNVAYDMAVIAAQWPELFPHIWRAYDEDRVTDTMVREQLLYIGTGRFRGYPDERGVWQYVDYNLASCARRNCGIALQKDGWRLRYGEFLDVPLERWEEHAETLRARARATLARGIADKDLEAIVAGPASDVITYPLKDASTTLAVYLAQEKRRPEGALEDEFRQARAAWWAHLESAWGVRTYPAGVQKLREETRAVIEALTADLVKAKLIRTDGSRDTKAATARMLAVCGWEETAPGKYRKAAKRLVRALDGEEWVDKLVDNDVALPLRRTKGGGVSLDRDACKASDDPILIDYGDRAQLKAVEDKDVPMLAAGTYYPIQPRVGLAASGRTTMSSPNLQNLRRLPGIREAIVPRPGHVFIQADYPQLELHTLGQACIDLFGASALADMLNAGKDPHLAFAAVLLGISYDEAKANKKAKHVDDARQIGKVFNFGSPGGLGAEKLCLFARKTYNVKMTVEQAKSYKQTWLRTLPEMRKLFDLVGRMTDNPSGLARIVQLRSKRVRGGTPYTAGCNTWFQGLGADAAKHAGYLIARAMYNEPESPLYASRSVVFVHDEFIAETFDDDMAAPAAYELARLMQVGANAWLPDCPFKAGEIEPVMMRQWSKHAHDCIVDGKLLPWSLDLHMAETFARGVAGEFKEKAA